MAEKIEAIVRKEFGKGASRRLRREDKMPAVVYGHGEDPIHIALDYHTAFLAIRGNANALLTLDIEGEEQLALVKDQQRNPLNRVIEHLDLLRVKKGEKVDVDVSIVVEGEPAGDAIATIELLTIPVKAPATDIPESFVVSVEGREEGDNLTIADIEFPSSVECDLDPEETIVVISIPAEEPEPEVEGEEGEAAEGEAAEGAEASEESAEGSEEE